MDVTSVHLALKSSYKVRSFKFKNCTEEGLFHTRLLYFQIILQEYRKAEQELQRHRLSRFSQNMPDTLYMIEPQKRRNTAPGFVRAASDSGRLEQEQLLSTSETLRAEENELDRYVRARRSIQMSSDSGAIL